ncbi:DUF3223 domain-containing protein [Bradyrhizobium sp. ma5]|uniref:DUF3223 domain-containing protein n=1 Tax=Bradyrhizobium sp. ma5 TaxID=3344828 RepID=UPI0035D4A8B9
MSADYHTQCFWVVRTDETIDRFSLQSVHRSLQQGLELFSPLYPVHAKTKTARSSTRPFKTLSANSAFG